MFKNYLVTAWKVLLRRKVFTFISLFGISITLAVLLILSTVVQNYLHPSGPEKNNDQFVTVTRLDVTSEDERNNWTSNPGFYFLKENVARMTSPELMSFYMNNSQGATFIEGTKYSNKVRKTDANYFEILDFDFLYGRPFTQQEFDQGAMLAVISKTTAIELFQTENAIDKTLKVNNQSFYVIGVVSDVSMFERSAYSDIWVPYTTHATSSYKVEFMGGWEALLYHSDRNMIKEMQAEYIHIITEDVVSPDPSRFHHIVGGADTPFENLARTIVDQDGYKGKTQQLVVFITVAVICFMLLPSINLINLNISRIMERSSEIGVRKAFGASTKHLVVQFITENMVITFLGGLLGLLLSWFVLYQIEASGIVPATEYSFGWHTFTYGFGMIFLFGLLSGTYPAYKMSKLHPVTALKGDA